MTVSAVATPLATAQEVRSFWIDEVGPAGWYMRDDALDARIRDRFLPLWERAADGGLENWRCNAEGVLAYLIVTDQFPRNMFRDDPRAFATDDMARATSKCAIHKEWDLAIDAPARQFFYLPLMHSENLCDQEHSVRLFLTRMDASDAGNLLHARAHREVIRAFGRFPYRNAALDRSSTAAEEAYLSQGGYGHTVEQLKRVA